MKTAIAATWHAASLAILGAGAIAGAQPAAAADSLYKGKTIKVIIRSSAGGGYDYYGRLIGRHIGRHLPGVPNVIAVNMPGAGGVVAANYLANRAKRDGTEIGILNRGVAVAQRMKVKGVKYDVAKLIPLGSPAASSAVWVIRGNHPVKSLADLKTHGSPIKFSTTGTGSASTQMIQVLKADGYPVTIITGYSGMSEKVLAVVRGDVDATCCEFGTLRSHIKESDLRVLAKLGGHPDLKAYPDVRDGLSIDARALTNFMAAPLVAGRPFFTSPGVAGDRVKALRGALKASLGDPGLVAEAKKAKRNISFTTPEEMEDVYRGILGASDKVVEQFKKL
ncbi:MAG: tripartite tricarboxylate transporter substrate-binding protein [Alphaproteobacteria bacterium]|nr:tripartite tricarboxylate transporter substrate-binding protein [Alphaproteobacteria bacterium]